MLSPVPKGPEFGLQLPFQGIHYLFSDHRKEFKAMTTAAGGQKQILVMGMIVNDEVTRRPKKERRRERERSESTSQKGA